MFASAVMFTILAGLSHWLFGWDFVWGEQAFYDLRQAFWQEDVGFDGNSYFALVRVKEHVFGVARELPAPFGDPVINSTPLAWLALGATILIPSSMLAESLDDAIH